MTLSDHDQETLNLLAENIDFRTSIDFASGLLARVEAVMEARDEAEAKIARVEELLNCGQTTGPGCCTRCDGTGLVNDPSTGGACWDCRASGHPHGPIEVGDLAEFIDALRRAVLGAALDGSGVTE